jgi:hypothetical protein
MDDFYVLVSSFAAGADSTTRVVPQLNLVSDGSHDAEKLQT